MLHKRLLQEGEEGKVLEEALFDRLWYVLLLSLPPSLPPSLLVVLVWMLHKRLLQEGEEGKVLKEALFDRL